MAKPTGPINEEEILQKIYEAELRQLISGFQPTPEALAVTRAQQLQKLESDER